MALVTESLSKILKSIENENSFLPTDARKNINSNKTISTRNLNESNVKSTGRKNLCEEESEKYYFNSIKKDIIDGSKTNLDNIKEIIKDNNVKCSKSAINNVLYLLKSGKNCRLCFGTFNQEGKDKTKELVSHVWVKDEDGKIIQTGVPDKKKYKIKGLTTAKSIKLIPSDLDNITDILKSKLNESLQEGLSFDLRSDVYNALGDIAFKYHQHGKDITESEMDRAVEWFMVHFFEDESFEESLEDSNTEDSDEKTYNALKSGATLKDALKQ